MMKTGPACNLAYFARAFVGDEGIRLIRTSHRSPSKRITTYKVGYVRFCQTNPILVNRPSHFAGWRDRKGLVADMGQVLCGPTPGFGSGFRLREKVVNARKDARLALAGVRPEKCEAVFR